jgi:hypothetical protein
VFANWKFTYNRRTMHSEFKMGWGYVRAVFRRWWVLTIEVVLVLLDLVERVFGIWLLPPLWAKVTVGVLVLVFAQYLVYRDQRKMLDVTAKRKEKLEKLATCMKSGRQFLYTPSSQTDWIKWASDVDEWMVNTFRIIQVEFGALAVEKFVNDAGMLGGVYPSVPGDFQQRLRVINRRLLNLDAIAQRPDAYL